MFNKDIENYIGPDGELTEEAAIKLYGKKAVYWEYFKHIFGGFFKALRNVVVTLVSCGLIAVVTITVLSLFLWAWLSAIVQSGQIEVMPTATANPIRPFVYQVEGISNPRFVRCIAVHQERILFTATTGTNSTLYAIDPRGLNSTCEMNQYIHISNPSRSPNGERIAYETPNTGTVGVLYLNSYNSQSFRPPEGYSNLSALAWSPDERKFVAQANKDDECSNLITHTLDGIYDEITSGEACDITPDWSPDGATFIFARAENTQVDLEIFSYDLTTQQTNQLTDNALQDYGPVWSPDGTQIMFASEDGIYIMDANGENLRRVIDYGEWPTWSPDGTRIAFVSDHENANGTETALFISNADGSEIRRITDYINANHPDWGP